MWKWCWWKAIKATIFAISFSPKRCKERVTKCFYFFVSGLSLLWLKQHILWLQRIFLLQKYRMKRYFIRNTKTRTYNRKNIFYVDRESRFVISLTFYWHSVKLRLFLDLYVYIVRVEWGSCFMVKSFVNPHQLILDLGLLCDRK